MNKNFGNYDGKIDPSLLNSNSKITKDYSKFNIRGLGTVKEENGQMICTDLKITSIDLPMHLFSERRK